MASSDGEESDDEDEAEGTETMNTTLTEGTGREGVTDGLHENSGFLLLHVYTNPIPIDLDPAERSMVEQYEHQLAAKKQEVIELQQQRDELRKTHARLVLLQSQILTPKVLV